MRSGRIDLRKILGTRNPADLLTKHSATRDKLNYLVRLFGCRYEGGRSAAAPALRKDLEGAKRTMANQQALAVTDEGEHLDADQRDAADDEWQQTILPHVCFTAASLDLEYPPLPAASEGIEEDQGEEEESVDPIEAEGARLATKIAEQMRTVGRVRDYGDF